MQQTRPVPPGQLEYRADIDGLRAIAVVPVVLSHFGVPGFAGGFVGVDVFFVISGYLITSLIFGQIKDGTFSVFSFYERRVRRIFPALFAMMAATLVAGALVFFPRDLMRLAESAAATALFSSNFDFWQQSGYFDVSSALKPLLHTWSLAVEEQFYLVFPALLYLMHTVRRGSLLGLVAVLAALSFAGSIWAVDRYPSAAFYLAPYRTWELMLGAMLALGALTPLKSEIANEVISIAGLAAISWAIFTFTPNTSFPGINALWPCLGTCAVIFGGEGSATFVKSGLTARPVVFVGLISYSFYLWHWPVRVFAEYLSNAPLSAFWTAGLIALSFVLAWLSWRFVERPFRQRSRYTRPQIFRMAAFSMGTVIVAVVAIFAFQGLPERFTPGVQRILREADDWEPRRHGCFNLSPQALADGKACSIGAANARTASFVLWGDSHSDALLSAVSAAAGKAGRRGLFLGHGRCPPLLNVSLSDEPEGVCAQFNDAALRIASNKNIAVVILVARWAYYDQGVGYGPDADETRRLTDLAGPPTAGSSQHTIFSRLLERTVRTLAGAGKQVVLVAPVPEPGIDVPEVLARAATRGSVTDERLPVSAYRERNRYVLEDLARLQKTYGATLVDPSALLCNAGYCDVMADGKPLYTDHHHLSVFGSLRIASLFDPAFVSRENRGDLTNLSGTLENKENRTK